MNILKKAVSLTYFTALFYFLLIKPVHAYIDPGTGSLIIQIVIGGMIGASIAVKVFWNRLISIFKKKS